MTDKTVPLYHRGNPIDTLGTLTGRFSEVEPLFREERRGKSFVASSIIRQTIAAEIKAAETRMRLEAMGATLFQDEADFTAVGPMDLSEVERRLMDSFGPGMVFFDEAHYHRESGPSLYDLKTIDYEDMRTRPIKASPAYVSPYGTAFRAPEPAIVGKPKRPRKNKAQRNARKRNR